MSRLYQVSRVGESGSPWELLANSPEHAIATIRKFYPETCAANLVATEMTVAGDPINTLNQLSYGSLFAEILNLNSGRPACKGEVYVRGDFDPSRNQYMCRSINNRVKYFDPYSKIIKL